MPERNLFAAFAADAVVQPPLRHAITQAYRPAEPDCVPPLLAAAALPPSQMAAAQKTARHLVTLLRRGQKSGGVEALVREYSLSSEEGVALMCLAEALLRIPDAPTRDALIRDKIGGGDWRAHLGASPSLFVNAATWGLVVTGRLTATADEKNFSSALTRLIARGGEPIIRKGVDLAMRMMGEQFVMGETIGQALTRAKKLEAQGFSYSYDMLGEAAVTAEDAERYYAAYETAIHAIGGASKNRGIYQGPGISIKLSALHPRYTRAQRTRVMTELLPRLTSLAALAQTQNIGLNIDAEESERLDLSLDLLEALCLDPQFDGWHGLGFVVQAYQKRAPFVLDFCIDLATRSNHCLMIRLVKGAYWDAEIKRAQIDGLEDFPVYTRKIYTDISYIACAKKLLAAGAKIYPQFATHNALTLATIHAMAGDAPSGFEFQCLHGMGEPLYAHVVGPQHLNRPCRIYAPVGTHETLLAYLVRRLLENGANTSFVNRISDACVSLDELLQDPVEQARAISPHGAPHDKISLPRNLFGFSRENSTGFDFANESELHELAKNLTTATLHVSEIPRANDESIDSTFASAAQVEPFPPEIRAETLHRAADLLEKNRSRLITLLVQEGCKTIPNAVSEIREAVDFLRYYGTEVTGWTDATHRPLGTVICISPWNFPLAIFLGQISAALAAGNAVIAKPAEETPQIAAFAVSLLHESGVPPARLHLVQGEGATGAALVADPRTAAVVFTGSTEVAQKIQRQLLSRTSPGGKPIPLIAETGGQNAMIVDSSALAEQVVADVIHSAFDSAGQRCSALRVLCLQEDAAPRILRMLHGALKEFRTGHPDNPASDSGPVISAKAAANIRTHIEKLRAAGHRVTEFSAPAGQNFIPPTIIEIPDLAVLTQEIFGPVLHVITFPRAGLDALIDAINSTGYGLTFGLHTRIDDTINRVTSRIRAGNIYINRNIVGAVVGVQPFGGHGLSGTGPKAGGPLYLRRLLESGPNQLPAAQDLSGPVGERNSYSIAPRGAVLCLSKTPAGNAAQLAAVAASGNHAVFSAAEPFDAALLEGDSAEVLQFAGTLKARPGPIIGFQALSSEDIAAGASYNPAWLITERVISINTAAAGGNASLMTLT
jgi:RHH-type proline utilization regulon transcriptional repressor/proline dehydrogenase/delta 1-pyrroline-5-carboxylate dehydrogenase